MDFPQDLSKSEYDAFLWAEKTLSTYQSKETDLLEKVSVSMSCGLPPTGSPSMYLSY
jgi:hypothetical protein